MTRTLRRSSFSVRLGAELLESREGPSSLADPLGLLILSPALQPALEAVNQPPKITDFKAVAGPNGQVTFTGRVTDDQPVAGTLVRIQGQGIDLTAIVQKDGTFSIATTVNSIDSIHVTAIATDALGLTSDPASTVFTSSQSGAALVPLAPGPDLEVAGKGNPVIIEAKAVLGSQGSVTIQGMAIDDKSLEGCLVRVTGNGVTQAGILDSAGRFSVSFQRPTSADFVLNVTVTDRDGNVSTPYTVLVSGI